MVDISTKKENDVFLIEVNGEVDASSSIQLDNAIKATFETEKKVLVDLAGLKYISSAGLGVFVSHLEEIKSREIQLVIFGMSESVYQIFSLLGLHELLTIADTKEQAIDKLS
jgi:anti-sigma B factor antagonist